MSAIKPADEGALKSADEDALQPAVEDALKPAVEAALPAIARTSILGLLGSAVVLGVVSATAGLAVAGWIAGLASGAAAAALLAAARMRSDQPSIHPADWVTLTRAVLAAGVAGLVADSFSGPASMTALVTVAIVALVLDAVDGLVARRTGTATPLGARLDGEVDAFLILLLSIAVSQVFGSWVLAIGAARYVFLLAGRLIPWLASPLPPRFWRKVVAAVEGIVLTVAVSGVLPRLVAMIALGAALLLLVESFGRDVIWLYRNTAGSRTRMVLRVTIGALAAAFVWCVLVVPDRIWQITPTAFLRIPVEGLVLVAVAIVLPKWPRRILATVVGLLIGLLTFAKILNMAFFDVLDRPFNPARDWINIPPALGVLRVSIGATAANIAIGGLVLALLLLIAAITAATVHITAVAARHRRDAVRGLGALAAAWVACAVLSVQIVAGTPVAAASTARQAVAEVHATTAGLSDARRFERAIHSSDPEARIPTANLLTGLRGKDVLIVFVESYGQVADRGTSFSPGVDAVLHRQTASLASAGWSERSAWLTSPTFGGISWLAHSTLESGLWVDSVQRYAQLTVSHRFTMSDAFRKAGWHTVGDDPSDDQPWTIGRSFYHFEQLFNRRDVGYQGPAYSYASMPDQYTLAEFQRNELAPGHKPVMAEIDLVSSHIPWAPLPTMVPWNKVGNGSVFDPQPAESESAEKVWSNANTVRKFFGMSIQYSLTALTSWITQLNDPNLVLIMLGDHQPHTIVSGTGPDHDVPISIIARDPSVFSHIASWHWQDGLLPNLKAPLEKMDAFRNQFLIAFSRR